ncbi:T9SS type A sorting domain-containing protein [Flavobacterium adhaerens]|uniref:T9SS type A sorting domain-containing protein n=1 Tax=Flavobacterium adhaerens TaxID=3149043 RepID=UPI0032B51A13
MKKTIFNWTMVTLLAVTTPLFAQTKVLPGQVQEPLFWLTPKANTDKYYWQTLTLTKAKYPQNLQQGKEFNNNPSIVFDSTQDSIQLILPSAVKRKQTLFMVYKVKDSLKEQLLYTISDTKKVVSAATNKRLADLYRYNYQSYNSKLKPQKANILFFQENQTDTVAKPSKITIAHQTNLAKLPPDELQGTLGEILVYDRVLSQFESQKIASYLAIKYGISLSQFNFKNYLNSEGTTIWDYEKHKNHSGSITAVGRDDQSGLLQLKSGNMFEEGLMSFEIKSESNTIPNNYFAFWSDNQRGLNLKKQEQGEPVGIDREWQLDFYNPSDLSLNWEFNPKFIKGECLQSDYYWLLVDYSGEGNYDIASSEYIKLASTTSKEKIILKTLDWDKQKSGNLKFTLKVAPEMFSRVTIGEATCGVLGSGQLQYTIEGGEAPYTITLKKEGEQVIVKQWSQTAKKANPITVNSGTYDYIVKDAKGSIYQETIFIADKQGTTINLNSEYTLTDGNALLLDGSKDLAIGNYSYQWFCEGNFIDNTDQLLIDQAGNYELRLTNDLGCITSKKISVLSDGKEQTDSNVVLVYPNPTPNGQFSIAMQYPTQTNVTISIYSPTGVLLKEKLLNQVDTQLYQDTIKSASGMYLLKVHSDFGIKIFKLIVK